MAVRITNESILQSMANQIELWVIDKLIPGAINPRTHSDARIAQIAQTATARLAARKLQLKEVPVIVLDHSTEAQKRAHVIADNQLTLSAGGNDELLGIELAVLEQENCDISLNGGSRMKTRSRNCRRHQSPPKHYACK